MSLDNGLLIQDVLAVLGPVLSILLGIWLGHRIMWRINSWINDDLPELRVPSWSWPDEVIECSNCGYELSHGNRHCPYCGNDVRVYTGRTKRL